MPELTTINMADNESPLIIPELKEPQKYHAFISHSNEDLDFAEELTTKLEDKAFKCFMYERDLPPDSTIVTGVCTNISISRRVILVVTKAFIASRWSQFEAMEAMYKGYNEDRMVLIPVLYKTPTSEIPHYLRNHICLEYDDKHFWKRLTSALIEERPATELIPAGNVAHGLAWSYFYGYLNLVLPGMTTRCEAFVSGKIDPPEMLSKMVIIIPSSCNCPQTLEELAPDMKHEGYIHYKASRAGNIERDYKSSVYRVKDPESDKEYMFIAEFATPVLSMYEMELGGIAGLNKGDKIHERMVFSDRLQTILCHPSNDKCWNKATLLEFDDETEEGSRQFPKLLCQHIKRELKKEKDRQEQIDEINDGYKELLVSKLADN